MLTPRPVSSAAFAVVSLEEAKARLQIEDESRDADLETALRAATEEVESRLGMTLAQRTWRGFLDAWPTDGRGCTLRYLTLPRPPVISVTHLKTYDDGDTATTVSAGDYYVDASGYEPRLVLRSAASIPTTARVANGIEIEWVAGYATLAEIPDRARSAILLLSRHLFDDPEGTEPAAVNNLLKNLRVWAF